MINREIRVTIPTQIALQLTKADIEDFDLEIDFSDQMTDVILPLDAVDHVGTTAMQYVLRSYFQGDYEYV